MFEGGGSRWVWWFDAVVGTYLLRGGGARVGFIRHVASGTGRDARTDTTSEVLTQLQRSSQEKMTDESQNRRVGRGSTVHVIAY